MASGKWGVCTKVSLPEQYLEIAFATSFDFPIDPDEEIQLINMIFLSSLAKTYALALAADYPLIAGVCAATGVWVDVRIFTPVDARSKFPDRTVIQCVLISSVAAAVLGVVILAAFDFFSIRHKTGIPGVSCALGALFRTLGLPVAAFGGDLSLTTMAGPLRFPVSLDSLGLLTPALMATFCGMYLFLLHDRIHTVLRAAAGVAALVVAAAILRMLTSITLFLAICDFVGYETEELPLAPFVRRDAIALSYLPFLLAAWPLWRGCLNGPQPVTAAAVRELFPARWALLPALGALLIAAWWEPIGRVKNGEVVINTFHTQWSRTDRPYDREWYGAASGYNYACFKRLYEVFYDVREQATRITQADLDNASVLVIYVPDRGLTPGERRVVLEFVRRGGGLFLIGDHTNVFGSTSHLNEISRPFGLLFRDDVLFDLDDDFFQLVDAPGVTSTFLHGTPFMKLRGPASIKPTSLFTRSIIEVGHAKSLRAIYSVNNFYPPPKDNPRMQTGRFCVSAASHLGKGRVVAFADSTIFSNFEIFYPGKYEYLLNVMHWLNHEDSSLTATLRRVGLFAALLLLCGMILTARSPRRVLGSIVAGLIVALAARASCLIVEDIRAGFPDPARSAQFLFFAAAADDPAYRLRAFTNDEPYDQRYDVFIQWVLRTGAFPGFSITGAQHRDGLYEFLGRSGQAETALGVIVRNPGQLRDLESIIEAPGTASRRLLLMFSKNLERDAVCRALASSGVLDGEDQLETVKAAWPDGDIVIEHAGRRVLLVFSAERFSDQFMGFSEKVDPNAAQRSAYDEEFDLLARLFENTSVGDSVGDNE